MTDETAVRDTLNEILPCVQHSERSSHFTFSRPAGIARRTAGRDPVADARSDRTDLRSSYGTAWDTRIFAE